MYTYPNEQNLLKKPVMLFLLLHMRSHYKVAYYFTTDFSGHIFVMYTKLINDFFIYLLTTKFNKSDLKWI